MRTEPQGLTWRRCGNSKSSFYSKLHRLLPKFAMRQRRLQKTSSRYLTSRFGAQPRKLPRRWLPRLCNFRLLRLTKPDLLD